MNRNSILLVLLFLSALTSCSNYNDNSTAEVISVHELNRISTDEGIDSLISVYGLNKQTILSNRSELELLFIADLFRFDNYKITEEILQKTIENYPSSGKAFDRLSSIELHEGNYDQSIQYKTKASKLLEFLKYDDIPFLYSKEYTTTVIPEDINDLFHSNEKWKSDTVLIYMQGGPDFKLRFDEVPEMSEATNVLKVYPYRAPILNPSILNADPPLTSEQAEVEIIKSTEILQRTVNHFAKQGKIVFIICHSHGSAVCMEYLSRYETQAEKIFLIGNTLDNRGKSDLNKTLQPGDYIRWKGGTTPTNVSFFNIPQDHPMIDDYNRVIKNIVSLVNVTDKKNYTELISIDNLKKTTLLYSNKDIAIGPVTKAEKRFLDENEIKYFILNRYHQSIAAKDYLDLIWQHLEEGTPLDFDAKGESTLLPEAQKIAFEAIKSHEVIEMIGSASKYGRPQCSGQTTALGFGRASIIIPIIENNQDLSVMVRLTMDPGEEWKVIEVKFVDE